MGSPPRCSFQAFFCCVAKSSGIVNDMRTCVMFVIMGSMKRFHLSSHATFQISIEISIHQLNVGIQLLDTIRKHLNQGGCLGRFGSIRAICGVLSDLIFASYLSAGKGTIELCFLWIPKDRFIFSTHERNSAVPCSPVIIETSQSWESHSIKLLSNSEQKRDGLVISSAFLREWTWIAALLECLIAMMWSVVQINTNPFEVHYDLAFSGFPWQLSHELDDAAKV